MREFGRAAVAAGLALHEDEFDIIFDDGIGFVGFTEEAGAALDFIFSVGDFVPNDGGEVIEADGFAVVLDGCVEGDNRVAAIVLAA